MSKVPLFQEKCTVRARGAAGSKYVGTSLLRSPPPLGPYRRPMPRVLEGFLGGGRFLAGEVPLFCSMSIRKGCAPGANMYCFLDMCS